MLTDERATEILNEAQTSASSSEGGNSRVVRVELGGEIYAVKDYSGRIDGRSRLDREWLALDYLAPLLPGLVARPVWRHASATTAIHSWLPGHRPQLDGRSVDALLERAADLHGLRMHEPAADLPPAVDAIRDGSDLLGQVRARCATLATHAVGVVRSGAQEVLGTMDLLLRDAPPDGGAGRANTVGSTAGPVLTLSPSDLGPHNLLQDPAGTPYRIIDLEFFGVDDAHKLIGDTILHPQNHWDAELLQQFLVGAGKVFAFSEARLAGLVPLLALKWSTIVLARIARAVPALASPNGERTSPGSDAPPDDLLQHFLAVARAAHHDERLGLVCRREQRSPAGEDSK